MKDWRTQEHVGLKVEVDGHTAVVTLHNPQRLRRRIDAALAGQGTPAHEPPPVIETNASVNAMALVRAGLGVAVLEPITPRGLLPQGLVVRPLDTDIPFFFGVVTPRSRALPPAVRELAAALLLAARALPGFVHHDPQAHDALLRTLHGEDVPAARRASSKAIA